MVNLAQVFVVGRVSYDLNPMQANALLEDVQAFEPSVGGFAGNVATGLARLGIETSIVSAVGDDPHGRYIRRFLSAEGVHTDDLKVDPELRTALAFYESWPPDRFPLTLFRTPTCPDWQLRAEDVPMSGLTIADAVVLSGTGLAREPSFTTTLSILDRRKAQHQPLTVLDLDWRPMLWSDPALYRVRMQEALPMTTVAVGGEAEFDAAGLTPRDALALGLSLVVLKRGAAGAIAIDTKGETIIAGIPITVTCALGAGDAFVSALTAGLVRGMTPAAATAMANAAGAIVAARPMCSPAMPSDAEVETILRGGSVRDGLVEPSGVS